MMDMRATAPFEWWRDEAQTPKPKNGDGFQGDSLDGSSFRSQTYVAQTPDWRRATSSQASSRFESSTPRPHTNPWNVGVPGSAEEHTMMDMRATAPFEWWRDEAQTPKPKNGDGFQGDSLDGFMDRRSHFSPTPAEFELSSRDGDYGEEVEMED